MKRFAGAVSITFLASVLITGCGFQGETEGGKTMDMQRAADRSDAMLDATLLAIEPSVQWAHDDTTRGSCDLTRRRAVMTVISEARRGSFLGMVERFWKKSGYEISSVNPSKMYPAIFARSPEGFGIGVEIAAEGQAHFEVNSPCVDKSEVRDPATLPNGPAYKDVEIPRPNVHSDFWSADTPVPS